MNIARNMEFIFITAAILIGATSYAGAAILDPVAHAAPAARMAVVHVSAKRLSAAEKARTAE